MRVKQRIVICGGSGVVGGALSQRLRESGYDVAIVSRHPESGEFSWEQLPSVLEGALAVVNLAGSPIARKFTDANKKEILDSRVNSTLQVGAAIEQCSHGPTKWINASATGYYGDRGDEVLTEESKPGTGFVADVCSAWESACLQSSAKTSKRILRLGIVLSKQGGALVPLIKVTKLFLGGRVGSGMQWMPWLTISDLTRLIQYSIENEMPEIVNACAPNPVQNRQFMAWLRAQIGRPWSPPVPAAMLTIVGKLVGPDASLLLGSSRVISEKTGGFQFDFPSLENLKLGDI